MNRTFSFQKAPRCSATSKRTRERCKAPAVRGWTVCRFHGARGGGPTGKRNGFQARALIYSSRNSGSGCCQAPNTSLVPVYDRITFFGNSALRIS
jgi:hypothetical protein